MQCVCGRRDNGDRIFHLDEKTISWIAQGNLWRLVRRQARGILRDLSLQWRLFFRVFPGAQAGPLARRCWCAPLDLLWPPWPPGDLRHRREHRRLQVHPEDLGHRDSLLRLQVPVPQGVLLDLEIQENRLRLSPLACLVHLVRPLMAQLPPVLRVAPPGWTFSQEARFVPLPPFSLEHLGTQDPRRSLLLLGGLMVQETPFRLAIPAVLGDRQTPEPPVLRPSQCGCLDDLEPLERQVVLQVQLLLPQVLVVPLHRLHPLVLETKWEL